MKQTTLCYLERDEQYLMLHRVKKYMHLFHATGFTGTPKDCDEGELAWIGKRKLAALQQWEGDRIFLRLMDEHVPFFSLKLVYAGNTLMEAVLNGKRLERS